MLLRHRIGHTDRQRNVVTPIGQPRNVLAKPRHVGWLHVQLAQDAQHRHIRHLHGSMPPVRIVDLTQPWGDRMPTWPQFASIEVTDITTHHRDRKSTVLVKTNMHTGTHIDAPIHYSETGKHLGDIPLADLVGTGLVIDLRPITKPWSYYSLDDVLGCMPKGEEIREGDVVVLYTGWDQYNWTKPTRDDVMYFDRHPGPQPEVIDYLIEEKRIKWLGADLASMDHSLYVRVRWMRPDLVREYEQMTGRPIDQT